MIDEEITHSVIGSFYDVHNELGFVFREHIYVLALERDLKAKGHHVAREVGAMVYYRGEPLAKQTLDMVVDDRVVVETTAGDLLHSGATLQLFGYLCATDYEVGLVLHHGREPRVHRVAYENRL